MCQMKIFESSDDKSFLFDNYYEICNELFKVSDIIENKNDFIEGIIFYSDYDDKKNNYFLFR